MRKAISLVELLVTIILSGIMATLAFYYISSLYITQSNIKTQFQAQLNTITATILQCKELSGAMPIDSGGSLANGSILSTLECNTTTPYLLNGGNGGFIPPALSGFSEYNATQNGTEFYISTSTEFNSTNYEVLKDLNTTYSTNQYLLTDDATTAFLNFYLSR